MKFAFANMSRTLILDDVDMGIFVVYVHMKKPHAHKSLKLAIFIFKMAAIEP